MNIKYSAWQPFTGRFARGMLTAFLLISILLAPGASPSAMASSQANIPGPAGSGEFGRVIQVLANGNLVVLDPGYDAPGPVPDVGAAYLYNGATQALISTLTGSKTGDLAGSYVTALTNGNFLVVSPHWDNGAAADAGSVTWGSGTSGLSGAISAGNSLVGSKADDQIGASDCANYYSPCVWELPTGNYLVQSPLWDNGTAADAGAVTWGSGTTGVSGAVSAANSLVGTTAGDQVGGNNCPFMQAGCVRPLANGNFVVISSLWDNGPATDAGAVTWGNSASGVSGPVSAGNSLIGSMAGDRVGSGGVAMLANGSYVVVSSFWTNGAAAEAGAVTWGSGTSGVSGVVSATNSLVGSTAGDRIGSDGVTALNNGNYVVRSQFWDHGAAADAGAVSWGSGMGGVSGVVSESNSLVGSTAGDRIGSGGVTVLSNNNYVVASSLWDNEAAVDAGAVTWGSGTIGVSGAVSAANSLVGLTTYDVVGSGGVTALNNGSYVVASSQWSSDELKGAGAVTWADGATGLSGAVSAANSLVGSTALDGVGAGGVTALTNGNYVVVSLFWNNGAAVDAGAVTWANGTIGLSGAVSAANSLVGSRAFDGIGDGGVLALSNGNYLVVSIGWDNGNAVDAGAVTWGNGTSGVSGAVSPANSLAGSRTGDNIGYCGYGYYSKCIGELSNGNYVVWSPLWDHGTAADAGAVTWGSGSSGVSGAVSAGNSLVGSTTGDRVGVDGVTALSNGNYVVPSIYWDNGTAVDAGAVTWGNGASGMSGVVSAANSLVGSTAGDRIGAGGVKSLPNGGYWVVSYDWDNGPAVDAGAVTWGNGATGVRGAVSAGNSLVGSTAGDRVGDGGLTVLSDSRFVVRSRFWDAGTAVDAGAVTLATGRTSSPCFTHGILTAANSVLGEAAGGGGTLSYAYDPTYHQLVVGRPADNTVSLFAGSDCAYQSFMPLINQW